MNLKTLSAHKTAKDKRSLNDFYSDLMKLPSNNSLSKVGRQMVELLPCLENISWEKDVYAFTSHDVLILNSADDYQVSYIWIKALSHGGYDVKYLLPNEQAPWPFARVQGEATNKEEACKMVEIALQRSGGW